MGKGRSVIKKKQKIEELKNQLKLNEQKYNDGVAQLTAQLNVNGLQKEQSALTVDEIGLVLKGGLKVLKPVFQYETTLEWEAHATRTAKYRLDFEKKKLANLGKNIEEINKQLESQASQFETLKKEIVGKLKELGLDEKDIFKEKIPSYIG